MSSTRKKLAKPALIAAGALAAIVAIGAVVAKRGRIARYSTS